MAERLWEAVTNLPVLVQGALGSALFACAVWGWRKTATLVRGVREGVLYDRRYHEYFWLSFLHPTSPMELRLFGNAVVLRKSMQSAVFGLFPLTLGLIAPDITIQAMLSGIAITYFWGAYRWLRPPREAANRLERLNELRAALGKSVDSEGSGSSAPTTHGD